MISIVNTECHVPKSFPDLAKIAAWGRRGHIPLGGNTFKPYVGVGLGAVGSHLKALGEDDGSVRFAWQLRAGAAVKVTKGIDLTADYTYRQTGSGKLNFGDEDVEYRLGKTKA